MQNTTQYEKFSDIAHKRLDITTQALSHYADGLANCPNLGEELTINRSASYHSWTMPQKDADELVRRVKEYWEEISKIRYFRFYWRTKDRRPTVGKGEHVGKAFRDAGSGPISQLDYHREITKEEYERHIDLLKNPTGEIRYYVFYWKDESAPTPMKGLTRKDAFDSSDQKNKKIKFIQDISEDEYEKMIDTLT